MSKLKAWTVTLSFGPGGPLVSSNMVAPDDRSAVAMATLGLCRQLLPEQELMGVGCQEITAEWLRWALQTIESGEPHRAPVVSLVSDNLRGVQAGHSPLPPVDLPDPPYHAGNCRKHGPYHTQLCPGCEAEARSSLLDDPA